MERLELIKQRRYNCMLTMLPTLSRSTIIMSALCIHCRTILAEPHLRCDGSRKTADLHANLGQLQRGGSTKANQGGGLGPLCPCHQDQQEVSYSPRGHVPFCKRHPIDVWLPVSMT